jgi:hypothetical protein
LKTQFVEAHASPYHLGIAIVLLKVTAPDDRREGEAVMALRNRCQICHELHERCTLVGRAYAEAIRVLWEARQVEKSGDHSNLIAAVDAARERYIKIDLKLKQHRRAHPKETKATTVAAD